MEPTVQVSPQPVIPNQQTTYPQKTFKKFLLLLLSIVAISLVLGLTYFLANRFNLLNFQTNKVNTFELIESSPKDQNSDFSTVSQPTFVFSKKIGVSESELNKYIQITPSVTGAWHIEKNGQVIYLSSGKQQADKLPNTLEYNTIYTISINKRLYSSDNQNLKDDVNIEFRTKQNPLFKIQPKHKLLNATANQPITILLNKLPSPIPNDGPFSPIGSSYTVTFDQSDVAQMLQYFKYKSSNHPLYHSPQTNHATGIGAKLEAYKDGAYQLKLDPTFLPETGLYFVTISNDFGYEDLFISVSNHINQIFSDTKNTNIWVSSLQGKSLGNASAELYSVENTPVLLDKVVTGEDGISKSDKSANKVDFVITRLGTDIAVTPTSQYAYFYHGEYLENYQTFSYSDRPIYRPGDTIHYKAIIRKKDKDGNFTIPEGKFYTQFILDYGQKVEYKETSVDQNGTIALDLSLPKLTASTYPEIRLSLKNTDGTYREIDTLPIVVQSYQKPDMLITADSKEREYVSSDSAHFTVTAKTNFGQPLTNVDFSYRVLLSDFSEKFDREDENSNKSTAPYYGAGKELGVTGNGRFDDKGQAQITFSTSLSANFELSQMATLEITPNIGASPSIGKTVKLIHRGEYALFIDHLIGDTENGISATVSVLDHSIPRQVIESQPLEVSLYKIVSYQNKQFIKSQSLVTDANGESTFRFQDTDIGSYELVATGIDRRGNSVTNRSQVFVGQKQQSLSNQSAFSLDLKTNKSSYKVGETANISVSANTELGDAVVVIAKGGGNPSRILSVEKYSINSKTPTLQIPIIEEFGNQIGVSVYSAASNTVIGANIGITIEKTKKQINTKVSFDKNIYKPGDTVTATITTIDQSGNPISADNSLSVIDSSLLQISSDSDDIFSSFYAYSSPAYIDHHDSTTGIYSGLSGAGGGGGGGGDGAPRGNFIDTAYWKAHIQTDSSGKATTSFKLPDNITTFTAHVISNTQDSQFGQGTADFVSQKDFNIIPIIAPFYYQGDQPSVSAIIQNSSAQDTDITLALKVQAIGFSKEVPLHITKGDFATAIYPMEINTQNNNLSFLIEARDGNNNILDSVLIKRPILPKGNIISSWQSFEGSKSLSIKSTFPELDFNSVDLWIIPNVASKIFDNYFYIDSEPSIDAGKKLYSYSAILANTRDGLISPTSYSYANLKNNFREKASEILEYRKDGYWPLSEHQTTDIFSSMNLWLAQGFDQTLKEHLLEEISNLGEIISSTKTYVNSISAITSSGETLMRLWILNNKPLDQALENSPEFLAVNLLNGDESALEKLRETAIVSSPDRYIWDGETRESQTLPVLAMVSNGTNKDAEKAIKGLSFTSNDSPLALLAGVRYMQRKNLLLEKPVTKITVNNESVYDSNDDKQNQILMRSFSPKNTSNGKIGLQVEIRGKLPVYTTIVTTDYRSPANDNNPLDNIKKTFTSKLDNYFNPDRAMYLDLNLTRGYKDIKSGNDISNLNIGESGIVVISADNRFANFAAKSQNLNSNIYSFNIEDAISPSFIYLDQTRGNSPQYQSTLDKIFPSTKQYVQNYITTSNYSDQAVFFNNSARPSAEKLIMPYVIYNVTGGSYYQPKTSIVFPFLGIISNEH